MMQESKKHTVLIIEDHPLIAEAYKQAFKTIENNKENMFFEIIEAKNCEIAKTIIDDYKAKDKTIDIAFLDIMLTQSNNAKIVSGEDLGVIIRDLMKETKIIVSTFLNNNYRIHNIIKNINPEGFLIKNDIDTKNLIEAINRVITNPPYYSNTVIEILRKNVSSKIMLDDIDRKILYELSIGSKMKELPNVIPLSKAGIEKRKRALYSVFNIKENSDRQLIIEAKKSGFI
ncbi:response regulator [Pontimicrobium sp. MEBiC06410]